MPDVPEAFNQWYDDLGPHLARAAEDVLENVVRFVDDWSEVFGFRCERPPTPRVKREERAYAKAADKGITDDFERLLAPPFVVGDLVGVRFVVRSRADVEAVISALQNQTSLAYIEIDDLSDDPRPSGYRALHVNGALPVVVRDIERVVPFEMQVKTLAQDAWGYFTHDTAYVPGEANQHPRFAHVRELQRLLADQLHNVDQLQQQIEVQAEQIATEVAAEADPSAVMFATVRTALNDAYGVKLSVSQAQRLARLAHDVGIVSIDAFSAVVAPGSDEAEAIAESYRADRGRAPEVTELVAELIRRTAD